MEAFYWRKSFSVPVNVLGDDQIIYKLRKICKRKKGALREVYKKLLILEWRVSILMHIVAALLVYFPFHRAHKSREILKYISCLNTVTFPECLN